MPNLFKMEVMTLVCDVCKERPLKTTIKIKDRWLGVCESCEPQREVKNEPI
jgi:hypothetical protein